MSIEGKGAMDQNTHTRLQGEQDHRSSMLEVLERKKGEEQWGKSQKSGVFIATEECVLLHPSSCLQGPPGDGPADGNDVE